MYFNLQKLSSAAVFSAVTLAAIGFSSAPARAAFCTGSKASGCYEITNGTFAGTDVTFSGGFILTNDAVVDISSGTVQRSTLPGFLTGGALVTTTPLTQFGLPALTFRLPPVLANYAAQPAPTGVGSVIGGYAPLGTYGDLSVFPLGVDALPDGNYVKATLNLYTSQTIDNSFTGQGGIYGGSLNAEIYDVYLEQSRTFPRPPIQTFSIPVLRADITPASVPTPALLPGLVGFSLTLWRKRKLQSL
jgi:hypothetical protein